MHTRRIGSGDEYAEQVYTHQESKLVCILAGCRDPHSSRPVVVEVGELVGESLDVLGQQP